MKGAREVSIALATYNGARYLGEQLQSLTRQTLLPAELVVSDDGSDDNTLEIIREFAATAPFPVRIAAAGERLGFADNFLYAAEQCRCGVVAFCDQDDVWLPHKLAHSVQRLSDDGSLMAMHRLIITKQDLTPLRPLVQGIYQDAVFDPLDLDPFMDGWGNSMVFDHRLLTIISRERRPKQSRTTGRPLSHDTWIYMLAAAVGRVSHILEPLILYRQHGSNTMGLGTRGPLAELLKQITPRTEVHRQRADINCEMALLLREAALTPAWFTEAATAAANRYHQRYLLAAAHAEIFDGRDFRTRYRAYRTMLQISGANKPRLSSRMKGAFLGVTGFAPK